MAELINYIEGVASLRSERLSEEEQLEGMTLLSVETCDDLEKRDICTFVLENFSEFLKLVRNLKREDQETLISYYVLSKTQNTLAIIQRSTQTLVSFNADIAEKTLACFIVCGGAPTVAQMRPILERAGMEKTLVKIDLSKAIDEFRTLKSFKKVAEKYNLHRPDIRRAMSKAHQALLESRGVREQALGAYIYSLIHGTNPFGSGYSKKKKSKQGHLYLEDPAILGQFRIKMDDPDFPHVFISRANR